MDRFVLNVFKAIMISMIMIFLFDMLSYFYRAVSLDQRMLNIMTGMQRVVMENNYLPASARDEYLDIFDSLAASYNGGNTSTTVNGSLSQETFITNITMNYSGDATGITGVSNLRTRLDTPAEYGDIMAIQVFVTIKQPIWGFNNYDSIAGGERGSQNFNRLGYRANTMEYTYLVPCLHYQRIQD